MLLPFHDYPFTDFHELNTSWMLEKIKEINTKVDNFITLNSLVFADPLQWDITTNYATNTIVVDENGDAYLSVKPVPAGVLLSNTEYWVEVFNFSEYVEKANKNLTDHYEKNVDRATANYAVGDWLIWNDVLYKVTQAISEGAALVVDTNIEHFTVEVFLSDFVTHINETVLQYKNDIDASESAYRDQLAGDIANTTATLQAELDAAIAAVTVDSEVIDARVGENSHTYTTLGQAIRSQVADIDSSLDLNFKQLLHDTNKATVTDGGVTFTYNANGTYTVSGTQSGNAYVELTDTGIMPDGFEAGGYYFIKFASGYTDVKFDICINGSVYDVLFDSNMLAIPAGTTSIYFRLRTTDASGVNETVTLPQISTLKNLNGVYVIPPEWYFETSTSSSINSALLRGNVQLTAGTYTITKSIIMQSNKTLRGVGNATVISNNGALNAITCTAGGEHVEDLMLDGGLTARPADYEPATDYRGININTDVYGMLPTVVKNVTVKGFAKDGILVDNRGYLALCSLQADNVTCMFNGSGITFAEKGEYGNVVNCVCIDNYFGCVDNGGNNKISNCGFDKNDTGLISAYVYNNAHSDVVGCSFNHNSNRGVTVSGITGPLTFTGCQFYGNTNYHILVIDSIGIIMTACLLKGGNMYFEGGSNAGVYLINGCIAETAPTISTGVSPDLKIVNSYNADGTPITA